MKNISKFRNLQDMKAPEALKERTLAAAREARRAEQENAPQHLAPAPRRRFGMAKRILAAACAFGVIVGGTAVWQAQSSGPSGSEAIAEAVAHSFGIVAYAADTGEIIAPQDSTIVFDDGAGVDSLEDGFYSGCLFKVTGENIATVSATMDRGGLYRTRTLQDFDVNAYYQMAEAAEAASDPRLEGADVVMPYSLADDAETGSANTEWFADACWKLENGFVDEYDPDVSYGFWAEPKPYDENADLRESWQARIDEFAGATLTVTVTFTDGTTDTQTLSLHTGKLGVEYTDGTSGPQLTGEVLTDEQAAEQGYLYGVYAEIEE